MALTTQQIWRIKIAFFVISGLFVISLLSLIILGFSIKNYKVATGPNHNINCTVLDYSIKGMGDNYCSLNYLVNCPNVTKVQETNCFTYQPCVDYSINKCIVEHPKNSSITFTVFDKQSNKYYGPAEYDIFILNKRLPLDIIITFPVIMGILFVGVIILACILYVQYRKRSVFIPPQPPTHRSSYNLKLGVKDDEYNVA